LKKKLNVNDKIVGRPIKLNVQRLEMKSGENFAPVVFLGDAHLGSPQFDQSRFLKMIDFCLKNKFYVFLMGDMVEMATRHSVGAGVYEQTFPGQTQYETMVEWLKPLAQQKLIIGLLNGNHESRAYKESGVNISKAMAREMEVPYLGDACWRS